MVKTSKTYHKSHGEKKNPSVLILTEPWFGDWQHHQHSVRNDQTDKTPPG